MLYHKLLLKLWAYKTALQIIGRSVCWLYPLVVMFCSKLTNTSLVHNNCVPIEIIIYRPRQFYFLIDSITDHYHSLIFSVFTGVVYTVN